MPPRCGSDRKRDHKRHRTSQVCHLFRPSESLRIHRMTPRRLGFDSGSHTDTCSMYAVFLALHKIESFRCFRATVWSLEIEALATECKTSFVNPAALQTATLQVMSEICETYSNLANSRGLRGNTSRTSSFATSSRLMRLVSISARCSMPAGLTSSKIGTVLCTAYDPPHCAPDARF
jgi:hypothetical protein